MSCNTRAIQNDEKKSVVSASTPRLSWPELEMMGKEDLIMKIRKDFYGVSTRGSKVSLMCRIRCNQAIDFIHAKRIELEIEEMQEYKKWRMFNQSHLGTTRDPDASKYPLVPPDFLQDRHLGLDLTNC
jgi:hypothetical protein